MTETEENTEDLSELEAHLSTMKFEVDIAQDAIKDHKEHVEALISTLNRLIEVVVKPGVIDPTNKALRDIRNEVKTDVMDARDLVLKIAECGLYETIPWNNQNLPKDWDEQATKEYEEATSSIKVGKSG